MAKKKAVKQPKNNKKPKQNRATKPTPPKKKRRGFKEKWKNVIGLYDELYATMTYRNSSDSYRIYEKQENKLGVDLLGTFEGSRITYYFIIQQYPKEISLNFKERLRREAKEGVRINYFNAMSGHTLNWDSQQMKSRLRVLEEVGEENSGNNVNAYNMHKNVASMNRQRWIEKSLEYLAVADKSRGRALVKTSMMMTVSGERNEAFNDTVVNLIKVAKNMGIELYRVVHDIPNFLKYYSPFINQANKNVMQRIPQMVMTDELVARFNYYGQGKIGNSGAYFGSDIYTKFPVMKVVKPTTETAENWIITAETGGGKSFAVKDLVLQLLTLNYNGTIMDVEGFEYIPLANFYSHNSKVVVVNMAEGSGNYFDPVEIFEPIGDYEIDKEAKSMSINFTLSMLKTLLGKEYERDAWLDTVIDDALSLVYEEVGVKEEMETWGNSKGLTLFDVYSRLFDMKREKYNSHPDYMNALEKAIAFLGRYFEEGGSRSALFKQKVNVSDIKDANLVICSFGMAGKSPNTVDPKQLALMQLGAAMLSHQRSLFSKAVGKFNFKLWEEFQRWGGFPDADKTIGVAITGGRKLGDVNIIITNDVSKILNDDKFSILPNWTSFLIGAIADSKVRKELVDRLSIPHMLEELNQIAKAAKEIEDAKINKHDVSKYTDSKYAYSFLTCLDRNKFSTVKFINPPEIAKSNIFRTGIDLRG